MANRPVLDWVILAFTLTVCAVLIILTVGLTIAGTIPPNDPMVTRYFDGVVAASATILGAVLGLVAGRAHGRTETPRPRD